jgi:hypothetical protein
MARYKISGIDNTETAATLEEAAQIAESWFDYLEDDLENDDFTVPAADLDTSSIEALNSSISGWLEEIAQAAGHKAFFGHGNYAASAASQMGLTLEVKDAPIHCQCGEIIGIRCWGSCQASDMVVVEFMPRHLRASHKTAGNSGQWPHNGSVRLAISRNCYDAIMAPGDDEEDDDSEWISIVDEADPYEYADED